jgi:hypothetical protein
LGKTWVLDTETKGTGAEMVPLEKVRSESAQKGGRPLTAPKPKPWSGPRPAPRPRRFKVIDGVTQRALIEDADARTTVDLLAGKKMLWKFSRPDIIAARAPRAL